MRGLHGMGERIGAVRAATLAAALATLGGCGGSGGDGEAPAEDDAGNATEIERPAPFDADADARPDDPAPDGGTDGGTDGEAGFGVVSGEDRDGLAVELPDGATGDTASPWLVFVDFFANASRTDFGNARASLSRYPDPVPFDVHVDFYDRDYIGELDTCVVRDLDAAGGGGGGGEGDPRHVSGGESLTISTADGSSFGELARVEPPGDVLYRADGTLPGPLPAGATLSIPGDVFPAVEAYPLLVPAPPERLSPLEGEGLSTTSEYRWVPVGGPVYVKLDFLADAADGSFRGFPVTCYVRDDGEFELTDEAVEALVRSADRISLRYSRVASRVELSDGVVFFVESEVSE